MLFDIIENMAHKLALITVVYENYTVLADFLKSLSNQSQKDFYLFIIDLSKTKKTIPDTDVKMTILKGLNKGYASGVNLGLKKAKDEGFEYFCVINNDTYFEKDFIEKIVDCLIRHPGSIIGGKIYYAQGFEFHKTRYKKKDLGKVIWFAGGKMDWLHALTTHIGVDEVDTKEFDQPRKVDFINGALMVFDKKILEKIGFWDEQYFLYFEDADYCVRAKKAGINLYYEPQIKLWHKNSQSTGGSGSPLHLKYQKINQLKFGLKYAPLRTKLHLLINYLFG